MSEYVVPVEIPSDGSSNVTQDLSDWIESCPDGSVLQFSGGRFRIDQTLELKGRSDLELDGQDATFFTEDSTGGFPDGLQRRARAHFRFIDSLGMNIHHLNIQGPMDFPRYTATKEAQHGFDFQGSEFDLYDVTVQNVWGDFVYCGRQPGSPAPSSGWIHRCVLDNSGRQGISCTAANDVVIGGSNVEEACRIGNTQRAIFDCEPMGKGWGVTGLHILNNIIGGHRLLFLAAGGNGPVNDVEVAGNIGGMLDIRCGSQDGTRRKDWRVYLNQGKSKYGAPINLASASPLSFYAVDDLVVAGNVQNFQPSRGNTGVTVKDCVNPVVAWNQFTGAKAAIMPVGDNSALKEGGNRL